VIPKQLRIDSRLLPYHNKLPLRDAKTLELLVFHATELPTLEEAWEYGCKIRHPETGVGYSGHYYVDRDGKISQFVEADRIAFHVIGHNDNSIGIEIVNRGRFPNWLDSTHQVPTEEFPEEQIASTIQLMKSLKEKYPSLTRIARHSDLDTGEVAAHDNPKVMVRRKIDPGPLFPWKKIQGVWKSL